MLRCFLLDRITAILPGIYLEVSASGRVISTVAFGACYGAFCFKRPILLFSYLELTYARPPSPSNTQGTRLADTVVCLFCFFWV